MCYRQHLSPDLPPEQKANPTSSDGIDGNQQQLKAVLTWPELTLLAVGMMIGAGIFAMPGEAIIKTGPGLVRAI